MKVIGITGTNASGKDTVAEYLVEKYGFKNYSLSDEIRFELTKKGLEHTRDNMIRVGNEIRENFDANELAIRAVKRIKEGGFEDVTITSIRNPAEIEEIKKNFSNFKLIFVDAPIELRYERSRPRGRVGDGESLGDFRVKEALEMEGGEKGQRLIACSKLADFSIINDGDLEMLFEKTEKIILSIY